MEDAAERLCPLSPVTGDFSSVISPRKLAFNIKTKEGGSNGNTSQT